MRAPLRFVYGNCVVGASGPWAVFSLAPHSYAMLPSDRRLERFGRLLAALEALEADFQILRVARRWCQGADLEALAAAYRGPHAAALRDYLDEQRDALAEERGGTPALFLAVSLEPPQRDVTGFLAASAEQPTPLSGLARRALDAARDGWQRAATRVISAATLERLRDRADEAHSRLAAYLDARPARTVELQWLIRRGFCRGLGEPTVEELHQPAALVFERNGAALLAPLEGDVLRWCDGEVEHRGRHLCIASELGTSWQAMLVAGALPERATFPGPRLELMFAAPESLPFGIDLSLCARFLPNDTALRLVRRRVQDADQIARAEAGGEQGISDRGYERTQDARDLLSQLQSASHPPLLRTTLTLAVAAASADELERRVQACRRAYGEVALHRPLGDQLRLFAAHIPGQRVAVRGYEDVLTAEQVAAMTPLAAHLVGSRTGFHLGHTLTGARHPVRLNLSEGSDSDRNTAILSIGALGSGKTTLDQKLAYEAFLLGARVIDCDPKGDHRMHLLPEVAPHVETISLGGERRLRGLLDPLRIAPAHLRQDAAVSFLCDLLPPRSEAAWETAILRAVDAVLRRAPAPTSRDVIRALADGDTQERQIAATLEVHAERGLTQLGFADPDVQLPAVGERQVTYLPIRDLPAPAPGTTRSEQSTLERVGEQIVRLIAMLAMSLMSAERNRLKVFSFDEGWRLLGDPIGRALLASLQRMGRSELAVPVISTQLVGDTLLAERASLENLIGATFVFGLRSEREAERALALLDLDPSDRALRERLLEFDSGRCLMRDHRGRVEAIQVELLAPRLLRAFSTSPSRAQAGFS